ncbi:nitroreductase [Candidatus Bathyarchaeota archaeon]|nr:MAG: nitroreductase [Candidatus Bathyarchaeota archaeon]
MEFMDVVKKRRSIRKYKPGPILEKVVHQILEAARLAPSGSHLQPWHFIVVKDPETKNKLGIYPWAAEAPIVIVGCTDPEASPRWHIVDLTIAFEHLVLAAASFGLGTCWIGRLYSDETTKKVLGIPARMKVLAVTPLGYPDQIPEPKTRKSLSEIVHYEKF